MWSLRFFKSKLFSGKSDPKEMSGDDILIKDPWGEYKHYCKNTF